MSTRLTALDAQSATEGAESRRRIAEAAACVVALDCHLPAVLDEVDTLINNACNRERTDIIIDVSDESIIKEESARRFFAQFASRVTDSLKSRGFAVTYPYRVEFEPSTKFGKLRVEWRKP